MKKGLKILLSAAFALSIAGCANGSSNDDKTIKIGATAIPHAEILNDVVKDELEKEGYTLEVTEFTDYVTPNTSLEDGDLDANYFQTLAYLKDLSYKVVFFKKNYGHHVLWDCGLFDDIIKSIGIYVL